MRWWHLAIICGLLLALSLQMGWHVLDPVVVAIFLVIMISWAWSQIALQRLGMTRSIPSDRLSVGETLVETMTLTNHAPLPKLWVEVDDQSTLEGHAQTRVINLPGRSVRTWEQESVATRRGRYRLGPVVLRASDPFGLFPQRARLPVANDILVYPARIDISSISLPRARMSGGAISSQPLAMSAATISSIREYQPGDPMNRLAWASTAHRGKPMVKEFDPDPTADIWIMLDLNDEGQFDLQMRPTDFTVHRHLHSTVEYIVSVGGGVAQLALSEGRKVGMILNRKDPVRLDADNSERQAFRIAETLAAATASGNRSLAEAIVTDHRQFTRANGLIVVTADPRSDWVAAAAALVERLVPVTAVLIDAGGEGVDDISPLSDRLIASRVQVQRYPTHAVTARPHRR